MNKNIDKYLYKLFLMVIKYTPTLLGLLTIINFISNYLGYNVIILSYLAGTSFTFLAILYIISWVFKFCSLFRIPLHYMTVSNIIGLLRTYNILSLDLLGMYRIYFILAGLAILVYVCYMYKNRNNPKVDYIKNLCDRYC